MRFAIDVSNVTFIAGSDPAGVMDMEGRQRADKATGQLLWGLDLVALGGEDGAEVWPVRIAGEPKGISTGQPVKVDGLTAMTGRYEMVLAGGWKRSWLPRGRLTQAAADGWFARLTFGGCPLGCRLRGATRRLPTAEAVL